MAREPTRVVQGEFSGGSWEVALRRPAPALRRHVVRLLGYDERASGPQVQRQFPVPFCVIIIDLGPPLRVSQGGDASNAARHPGGFAAGLGGTFADTAHEGHQRGVQVDLTPTGARRVLGVPMDELADRVVSLRDLQPELHRHLAEELAGLPDWPSRLDRVEDMLLTQLCGRTLDTRKVDWALARIGETGGAVRIASLARELDCSSRHLIALFRDQVGVSPKLCARLVRFQRLMRAVERERASRWVELALDHGYFDQAHLVRDVRSFTGLTPTQLRAQLPGLARLLG